MTLSILISPRHFVELSLDELRWTQGEWRFNYLRAALDGADIITVEGVELVRVLDSEEVRLERANNEGFDLDWNATWALYIESFKACFPYEHQYTNAIQNELISVRKWLKEIHAGEPVVEKPLPSDLVIKVCVFRYLNSRRSVWKKKI